MALSDCPMCNHPIPIAEQETSRACGNCGADLTRWNRKPASPPPLPVAEALAGAEVQAEESGEFNMSRGILGAFTGACVGAAAMYGFFRLVGFRFPLLGVGIGFLTGYFAKLLFKGTDNTLGIISAVIATISVTGTLFLMYGEFPIISIISVIVSASVAYRVATS